jgi:RHS repeat-associated protein
MALGYDENGNVATSNGIVVGHDADDRIETVELAPGKTVTYRYDDRGMLTSIEDWMGQAVTFTNDESGLLDAISRANGVNTSLGYDVAGRLDTIEEPGISLIDLSYDARGRLTEATRNVPRPAGLADAGTAAYSYDAASQTEQFSHDALGRRTADDRRNYEWNLASRMTGYTVPGASVALEYDAMGYRTQRSDAAGTREYVWNYALALPSVSVERQDGADRRYYVHTPSGDLLYSVEPDGERRFYHYDERGNTLYITGASGNVLASYAYSPYGEVIAEQGGIDNAFTFMGKRGVMREADSDLYYARARYYDAKTGRFLSRDAERSFSPKRGNPYQYARGNPLMFTDPTGLDEEEGWFSSMVRRGGNWLGKQADNLVNAGLGGATLAGRKWDAMADTVRAGLGGTWLSVSSKLDEFVGIRADIRNNTGKPGVFSAGKNIRLSAEQNRILRSISKNRALARLLETKAFGINIFGAMVSALAEPSGNYTNTKAGIVVGKGVIGGANAAIGHSGGPFATFVGVSSLVDAGTDLYYSTRYGEAGDAMEGIRSGAHEVLFHPLRMLVAAGEDFVTEPTSNGDSALYKLAQTMKSADKDNLGAATFGLYELGEDLEEKYGISDYLVGLFADEDEE